MRLALALLMTAPVASAQGDCFETLFVADNGGAVGGAVYFDLTTYGQLSITHVETSFDPVSAPTGTVVGVDVYLTPGTAQGNTASSTAWTLVASGSGASTGVQDMPSRVDLIPPLLLPAGSHGVALVAIGASHDYTSSCGISSSWSNGDVDYACLGASNVPFAPPLFQPRLWNGRLCYDYGPVGMSFCGPAVPNSTGASGEIVAIGSASTFQNELRVETRALPTGRVAYFLTSRTPGASMPPSGTIGTLCLAGAVGRYNAASQIRRTDAAGRAALDLDLAAIPGPSGPGAAVAGETWHWQCWYRDTLGGSNFTDGVEISLR